MMHLILGGARSGKSGYAESLLNNFQQVTYIATATGGDDEMRERIKHHKASRPDHWQLIEEPFYLSTHLETIASDQVLIIDCMTLWLSNWLCSNDESSWQEEKSLFINVLLKRQQPVFIVSNEVGSGVIPMGELSRQFVDQAGWLNQALAQVADKVTLVVAGCPLQLKPGVETV